MLREESDSETSVLADESLGRLELADEKLEDGGFTGTVGPNDTDTGVKLYIQINVLDYRSSRRIRERNARHLHDRRTEALDIGELEHD